MKKLLNFDKSGGIDITHGALQCATSVPNWIADAIIILHRVAE